ncbi:MAG: hypothetical protein KA010_00560 [Saprospiraceae bacterium]|nr:hypothetical protein [Saprospiraceae bacterium]
MILKRIHFDNEILNYIRFFFYPVIIILLPLRVPQVLMVLFGFAIGLTIDVFYDSLGVHASALTFTAFMRYYVLNALEPRGGYNLLTQSPTKKQFGNNWFLSYLLIMYAIHIVFYFSVEVFTFVYWDKILLYVLFSYVFSVLLALVYIFIFDPVD